MNYQDYQETSYFLQHSLSSFHPFYNSLTKVTCKTHNGNYHSHMLLGQFAQGIADKKGFIGMPLYDALWTPHHKSMRPFPYIKRGASAVLIIDEEWSTDEVAKYQGLNSLSVRPFGDHLSNARFLMEAKTEFPNLKLCSFSYDPKVFYSAHGICNVDFQFSCIYFRHF